jgi:hypothetical protein
LKYVRDTNASMVCEWASGTREPCKSGQDMDTASVSYELVPYRSLMLLSFDHSPIVALARWRRADDFLKLLTPSMCSTGAVHVRDSSQPCMPSNLTLLHSIPFQSNRNLIITSNYSININTMKSVAALTLLFSSATALNSSFGTTSKKAAAKKAPKIPVSS